MTGVGSEVDTSTRVVGPDESLPKIALCSARGPAAPSFLVALWKSGNRYPSRQGNHQFPQSTRKRKHRILSRRGRRIKLGVIDSMVISRGIAPTPLEIIQRTDPDAYIESGEDPVAYSVTYPNLGVREVMFKTTTITPEELKG